MGSLMAGWDSSFQDPEQVTYQRNKSLTKDEIAAYWKSMNKPEENNENQENMHGGSTQELKRSHSLPLTDKMKASLIPGSKDDGDEKLSRINCWWTRSKWAFLNEPPVMATEGTQKYAAQFHVAT
ncbi:uncharacterized protein LOC109828931 isoform X1 [Asparagus officinalis]|uniref:uncharacterized protein LOC109828931 isoform X1 n=1 Tax=Asparagus officinalis TaxID=4686 RepID=UPI00098E8267|nr:uncharacterized protein LOC109828931 isoform X1 [Asparagus officinalis]